jgi:hypothetical protein
MHTRAIPDPYMGPDVSSSHAGHSLLKIHDNIILPVKPRPPNSFLSFRIMEQKFKNIYFLLYVTCPSNLVLLELITTIRICLWITNCEASHYAAFSSLRIPPPSSVQTLSSASCSQIFSIYDLFC